jgi:hypothetical protein
MPKKNEFGMTRDLARKQNRIGKCTGPSASVLFLFRIANLVDKYLQIPQPFILAANGQEVVSLRTDEFSRFSVWVRQGLFDDPLECVKRCHDRPMFR